MPRIQIFAARTWGAMGNYLAAQHLARVLRSDGAHRVDVHLAEDLVDWVATCGQQIKRMALRTSSSDALHSDYSAFAAQALSTVPPGFEVTDETKVDLEMLLGHLAGARPDLVIATKGVISRLLTWAVRHLGLQVPVWHYVTNPGLFEMGMHQSPHADLTTVPFDWDAQRYVQLTGCQSDQVRVVGPLLSARSMPPGQRMSQQGPLVLCFNNRGGAIFTDAMLWLAENVPSRTVVYLAVDQPEELTRVGPAFADRGWLLHDHLPQERYLEYLSWAGSERGSFLLCKASPATVFEAVDQGIPVLAVPSGLPQEDWLPDLIRRHGLGRVATSDEDLRDALTLWQDTAQLSDIAQNAGRFRDTYLDQDAAERRVRHVAADLINHPGRPL